MKKIFPICLCLSLAVISATAHAQNYVYAAGNQALSTQIPIESGFINVNNGDLHIEIPLATHAQRGRLQLSESLVYDSRIWKIVSNGGNTWHPTNVPNSMGGWRFSSGTQSGTFTYNTWADTYPCNGPANLLSYNQYWNFRWTDPTGAEHQFPSTLTQYYDSAHLPVHCLGYSGSPVAEIPNSTGYASDGSGYYAVVSNYNALTIYDPQGNQYKPTLSGSIQPPATPQVTDTNGNYWSQDSNGNLIDTLGRTPVEVSQNGNQIDYAVLGFGGVRSHYTVTTETINYSTAFSQSGVTDTSGSFTAIQSISLPDGSAYSFTYDSGTASGNYGELKSVTLPTGGVIQYTYTNFLDSFQNKNRWVNTRVKDGGTTTFVPSVISQCSSNSGCQEKTTVTSPMTTTSPTGNDTVYTFTLDSGSLENASSWNTGIDVYQGSSTGGGTKLKSVTTTYTYTTFPFVLLEGGTTQTVVAHYQVPASIATMVSLPDVGLTSQVLVNPDSTHSRPSTIKRWDYYPSSGGAPSTPTTETDYSYSGFFPTLITVKDGSGLQISQTSYAYDETMGTGHAALAMTSGLNNHQAASGTRYNLTTTGQWLNTSGGSLSSEASYDDAGTLLTRTDPTGATTYKYDNTDMLTMSVTPPTPSSGVAQPSAIVYDSSTGLLSTMTDPNTVQTSYPRYDAFGRVGEIDTIDGKGNTVGKTTAGYTASQSSIYSYQSGSVFSDEETLYDAYGRISRTATANGQSSNPWYQQDICYDPAGNTNFVSYKYQGSGFAAAKICSGPGDSYTYDALGRLKTVTHSDLTSQNYSYLGRASEITDENGVSKISQTDGLGRLVKVCEVSSATLQSVAPVNCGTDISATGFFNTLTYDLANHKTTVTQGAQTRVFQTDSLGRTVSVTEPERGITTYGYSYSSTAGLGLVVTRNRPTPNQGSPSSLTTTTFAYDSLSRLIEKSYSDGEGPSFFGYDVPSVTFDPVPPNAALKVVASLTNPIGRLAWTCREPAAQNSCVAQDAFSYDPLGRITQKWSSTPSYVSSVSPVYTQAFTFDWLGNTLTASDAAGATTTYHYSPGNEVLSISSSLSNATHPASLVSNVQNGPNGPISFNFGNGLSQYNSYNQLGRLNGSWVCVGAPSNGCSSQKYGFLVAWQGSRVKASSDDVVGASITYGYDDFNRLTSMTNSSGQQLYSYTYDRYGNRWSQNALQGGFSFNQSFSATTNEIIGFTYDAAGNLLSDGSNTYTYDAEGNLLQQTAAGLTSSFTYDALNQQVRTDWPSFGVAAEVVFNPAGQLASLWEPGTVGLLTGKSYWGQTPIESYEPSKNMAYFAHRDWVGTRRAITDATGAISNYRSSLPFGDGGANTYGNQDNSYDGFAGLWGGDSSLTNHAQYREYWAGAGRWLQPDPYDGSYDLANPESLNRYSYVGNNPLAFNDPTGQACEGCVLCTGGPIPCVAGIIGTALLDWGLLDQLFGGPSFHGSLHPRPSGTGDPNWDGNFGESLGIGRQINTGTWGVASALGLPDAGCDFGPCNDFLNGNGPSSRRNHCDWLGNCYLLHFDPFPKRLFGSHWCGPGGAGDSVSGLDRGCRMHDACYDDHGFSSLSNYNPFLRGDQVKSLQQCNQNLCDAAQKNRGDPGSFRVFEHFSNVPVGACSVLH